MGEKCHFAHGEQELRKPSDPIPVHAFSLYSKPSNFGNDYAEQRSSSDIPPGYVKNNYKTIPCKFYMQDGHCSFGERCTYAHGEEDLRPLYVPASVIGQDQGYSQGGEGDPNAQYDENGDTLGRGVQDNHMYTMIQGNQHESKDEVEMQLLDNSADTKRNIYAIVNMIESQNYEEAKKLVTLLHENNKIWFTQINSHFKEETNHQSMMEYDDLDLDYE